jgi:hypothetical protein
MAIDIFRLAKEEIVSNTRKDMNIEKGIACLE